MRQESIRPIDWEIMIQPLAPEFFLPVALPSSGQTITQRAMTNPHHLQRNYAGWSSTLWRVILISAGGVAILLPAWLPNQPSIPIESGAVEILQALLLAASAVVMFAAESHAGFYRPICRVMALGLIAALIGEIEDFVSDVLGWRFPESVLIGLILAAALISALRNRRVMREFFARAGHHAGTGFIAAALLINYVFNIVIGSRAFWQAALGSAFSPTVPKICKSYLELLACYLIFIGALGIAATLARRHEPG